MELNEFIKKTTCNLDHPNRYIFILQRWSKNDSYWYLMVCERKYSLVCDKNYSVNGHYSFSPDANIHDILTVLANTGVNIKICNDYFKEQ